MEDYDREKDAKEAATKVRTLAEERMKRMEKELMEYKEQLNRLAAQRMAVSGRRLEGMNMQVSGCMHMYIHMH